MCVSSVQDTQEMVHSPVVLISTVWVLNVLFTFLGFVYSSGGELEMMTLQL